MSRQALLVEDDDQQVQFTSAVLQDAGFKVLAHKTADSAAAAVSALPRPLDLVVLDRRLPQSELGEATDAVGDALLNVLLDALPDTPFVVFSGYTGLDHFQFATKERGVVSLGPSVSLDRVTPFDKSQSIEFAAHIHDVAARIDVLDDIEAHVSGAETGSEVVTRRLLKRVALELGGASISAESLVGGLAGASVWLCQVRAANGVTIATVVVKQSSSAPKLGAGGFHTLLPGGFIAAPTAIVTGLCGGDHAQVMQVAGGQVFSLLDLLGTDPDVAAEHLARVIQIVEQSITPSSESTATIAVLCTALGDWDALRERLAPHGITLNRGSLVATTKVSAQHGDLHPGNILVSGEHPIVIDFDSEAVATSLLDPVTALLSPIFHADSPMRGSDWPTPMQCRDLGADAFFESCPCEAWMRTAWDWTMRMKVSDRELWSLVLAYAGKQLKYSDVLEDSAVVARALALVTLANDRLGQS